MLAVDNLVRTLGADFKTLAAADALVFIVHQYGMLGDGLRIMTPGAVHVAALEENGCTDSRTVVERESLYVGDTCGHRLSP